MRSRFAFAFLMAVPALMAAEPPAAGMNRFAVNAYHDLAAGPDSLIYSPFSISTAVSMLLAGARGATATDIATALGQPGAGTSYHSDLAALVQHMIQESNSGGSQLSVANALWLERGIRLEPGFQQIVSNDYKAPLTPLNFSDTEQCRREINSWTERQTNGKIANLFAPGSIDAATRLVLTSAIYFNGSWQLPFQSRATHPDNFRTARGTVQADFMHQTARFRYAEPPGVQVLEMKYSGTPLAFAALLPQGDSLKTLENSLSPENLAQWFSALNDRRVQVSLPKFRAESSFSLRAMLSRMGMSSAFNSAADFSGIDGKRDLNVSDVVHKAFVEVNETGTVAAAATGAAVAMIAMRPEQPAVFRADHPFIFIIRDTKSGAILFAGRVMNPKA